LFFAFGIQYIFKDSRGPGVKTVTRRFPNKEIYSLTSGIKRKARGCRENAKNDDQYPGKQTLESLNPGLLEPFFQNNWEKILIF